MASPRRARSRRAARTSSCPTARTRRTRVSRCNRPATATTSRGSSGTIRPCTTSSSAKRWASAGSREASMKAIKRLLGRLDEYQQRHRWLAFPLAVNKKFGDDQAGNLAALIAYYGFFSLFPLLLVLVTILGFALQGNPSLQHDILNSTFKQFPVIGDQLQRNVHSL